MIIRLRKPDVTLLEKVLQSQQVTDITLLGKVRNFNEVNNEDIENIIDVISDELMQYGFEKDYEPNKYGLQLEDLLDKVNKPRLE
ncbi:MAG: hypothetical protein LBE98_03215 [Puniceicoccales bacterium]|nr:hypothetical protein [Puniceicoccales bacterium]